MRQAISTKFLPPTNFKGARISVSAEAGRKVYEWDHALNPEENHEAAARAYAVEKGWLKRHRLVGGAATCNPNGYVFVLVEIQYSIASETVNECLEDLKKLGVGSDRPIDSGDAIEALNDIRLSLITIKDFLP